MLFFTDMLYHMHLFLVVLVLVEHASFAPAALQIGKIQHIHTRHFLHMLMHCTFLPYNTAISFSYFLKCGFIF